MSIAKKVDLTSTVILKLKFSSVFLTICIHTNQVFFLTLRLAYLVANRMMRRVSGRSQPFGLPPLSLTAILFRRVSSYQPNPPHLSSSLLCGMFTRLLIIVAFIFSPCVISLVFIFMFFVIIASCFFDSRSYRCF